MVVGTYLFFCVCIGGRISIEKTGLMFMYGVECVHGNGIYGTVFSSKCYPVWVTRLSLLGNKKRRVILTVPDIDFYPRFLRRIAGTAVQKTAWRLSVPFQQDGMSEFFYSFFIKVVSYTNSKIAVCRIVESIRANLTVPVIDSTSVLRCLLLNNMRKCRRF